MAVLLLNRELVLPLLTVVWVLVLAYPAMMAPLNGIIPICISKGARDNCMKTDQINNSKCVKRSGETYSSGDFYFFLNATSRLTKSETLFRRLKFFRIFNWKKDLSSVPISCTRATELIRNGSDTELPPGVCGLCPEPGPQSGLDPCNCTNNGGSLGGTISIYCPPAVNSQAFLTDIIQRTTFFTNNVSTFSLVNSNISGVLDLRLLSPLTVRGLLLDGDRFQSVDSHAFNASASTLTSVSLADNVITYFHFGCIDETPLLKSLDLSGNLLEFIPSEAFKSTTMKLINLSRNNIYTVSFDAFKGSNQVEIIDLSENNLSDLQDNVFRIPNRDNNKVIQIDISGNYIRYISPLAFTNLKNFQINMMNNQLTTLNEAVFLRPILDSGYFAYILADGNLINCDCGIFWIVRDSLITNCFDNFHCQDRNRTLYQLEPDDFPNCQEMLRK